MVCMVPRLAAWTPTPALCTGARAQGAAIELATCQGRQLARATNPKDALPSRRAVCSNATKSASVKRWLSYLLKAPSLWLHSETKHMNTCVAAVAVTRLIVLHCPRKCPSQLRGDTTSHSTTPRSGRTIGAQALIYGVRCMLFASIPAEDHWTDWSPSPSRPAAAR